MRRRSRSNGFDTENLTLDPVHRKLGGVCAGIANYLDWSRFWVRVAAILALCLSPHAALLGYGLAYLILDQREPMRREDDYPFD